MKFTDRKDTATGQGIWTVTIDGDQWKDMQKKAKKVVAENLVIPGFRKGKAPKSEIDKNVTPAKIYNEAFKEAVEPAFQFALAQKSKIEPITPPAPTPYKVDENEMVIDFTFDLKPDIKLGKYKGITSVEKIKPEVTDQEVEDVLKKYQENFAMESKKDKDAPIEKGDVVTFDFKGYTDGKPFAGGEAKDYKLEIGSNQFVPGFEDAMIGLKLGKEQKIKIKFPMEYTPELAGKDAEFVLNIKEVAKKELPALDDDLAKDVNLPEVKTLADLKAKIKEDVASQKQVNEKNRFVDEIIKEIINDSTIDLPKSSIQQETKHLKADFEKQVQGQGLTMKDYKKATGLTDADLEKELELDAKNRLMTYLVTSEIQKAEKFEVSEKEIADKLADFSKQFGIPAEQLKTMIPMDQLKAELEQEKLVDFLYENNGK